MREPGVALYAISYTLDLFLLWGFGLFLFWFICYDFMGPVDGPWKEKFHDDKICFKLDDYMISVVGNPL